MTYKTASANRQAQCKIFYLLVNLQVRFDCYSIQTAIESKETNCRKIFFFFLFGDVQCEKPGNRRRKPLRKFWPKHIASLNQFTDYIQA